MKRCAGLNFLCKRKYFIFSVALIWVLFVDLAQASGRVALLIGNEKYEHQTWLRTPVNDIDLIENVLVGLGFKVTKKHNLSKIEMNRELVRFVSESAVADVALFYYAGHGQQSSKGAHNYLLPVNAKISGDPVLGDNDLETEAVQADEIVRRLESVEKPAKIRLVILDACRNNPKRLNPPRASQGLVPVSTGDQ